MKLRAYLLSTVAVLTLVPATGCFDPDPLPAEDESGDTAGATDTPAPTTTGDPGNTSTPATSSNTPATTTATTDATATTGMTTIDAETTVADEGSTGELPVCEEFTSGGECNTHAQDCPPGEKCMPWANDGGGTWNDTRCVAVDASPAGEGEPCSVEGSSASGIDNCERGTMCFNVDPETNLGTCTALCGCDPLCDNPQTMCSFQGDGVLNLCIEVCDPLLQACPDGQGCYPVDSVFYCVPDASGPGGGYLDPCMFINACDPGLACINGDALPGCDEAGCCAPFCDTGGPFGQCPSGLSCAAWFEPGMAPPGWETVGICADA